MKTYRIPALIALVALLAAGCVQEHDYEKKIKIDTPANFAILVEAIEDTVVLMSPRTKSYTVRIEATSIADDLLTLTIGSDPSKADAYNLAHGTSFEMVPGDAFSLTKEQLFLPRYNKKSSTSVLTLRSGALPDDGATRILPLTVTKIEGTSPVSLAQTDSTFFIFFRRKMLPASGFEVGTGTEDDPYIISNQAELASMAHASKSGQKTWFKMVADVDLSDYEDWSAVNIASPYDMAVDFDGDGHKIVGFNCNAESYPSFVGVLNGCIHDVVFENPVLTVGASPAGLIAAQSGTAEGAAAEIRNVTVTGLTINLNGTTEGIGGLVGRAYNTSFSDITLQAEIIDADADEKVPNSVGGIVGVVANACQFNNIETSGFATGAARVGGLIGYIIDTAEGVTVERCSSAMEIVNFGANSGGLIGLAYAPLLTVTDSHATGNVTNNSAHYCGGLIGSMNGTSEIRRCYATGNVLNKGGNHVGGLIGNAARTTGDTLIEDCYATGNVTLTASNGRMVGGLIGVVENKTGVTVRRCYATGDVVSETSVAAGLVSFAKSSVLTDLMDFTLEDSIAWNALVSNQATGTWSSGAIIGVTNVYNTLTNNYRRSDMVFLDGGGEILYDCPNVSPSAPLIDAARIPNYYPYHGKAAPEGATISSVAASLGWPADVWDLAGDTPKLK